MGYCRVVPRDLFNEAKLLKCLGALYIETEGWRELTVSNERMDDNEGFDIRQDPNTGNLFCTNVDVILRGEPLPCFAGMNSRLAYPLIAAFSEDDEVFVFNDDGTLSKEFLALVQETAKA
jgi:hypothetical protein